jgi:hypothetical protein
MYLFLITLLTPFTFLVFGEDVYVAVDFAEIDGCSLVLALPIGFENLLNNNLKRCKCSGTQERQDLKIFFRFSF